MKKVLLILLQVAWGLNGTAQVNVASKIDTTGIRIGEQAHYQITVTAGSDDAVTFPQVEVGQELAEGVEVVAVDADTVEDKTTRKITRTLALTAWEAGDYNIPEAKLTVNGKTYTAQACKLSVAAVEVDTLNTDSARPPMSIVDNPFSWKEWLPLLAYFLLALCLAACSIVLHRRLKHTASPFQASVKKKQLLPHEQALEQLALLEAQAEGIKDQKDFYTRLTDTLRIYLDSRYGMDALEMTTAEIIQGLKEQQTAGDLDHLQEMLAAADLVKFAKQTMPERDGKTYISYTRDYVNQTKVEVSEMVRDTELPVAQTSRVPLYWLLLKWLLALAAIVILVYVVWQVYELLV